LTCGSSFAATILGWVVVAIPQDATIGDGFGAIHF